MLRAAWCAARVSAIVLLCVALQAVHPAQAADVVRWSDVRLLDGRTLTARELAGKTVVVQIWASWCPFCAAQNPHVQKLHEATRSDGLIVLTFSIDRTEQAAREYLAKRAYTFHAAMYTQDVEQWFGKRRTLPEIYVVDPKGRVVFQQGGEMFAEDIAALARFAAR